MVCTIYIAKTKAPVSCAVTAQLSFLCSRINYYMQKAGFLMTRLILIPKITIEKCAFFLRDGQPVFNLENLETFAYFLFHSYMSLVMRKPAFLHMRKQRRRSAAQ